MKIMNIYHLQFWKEESKVIMNIHEIAEGRERVSEWEKEIKCVKLCGGENINPHFVCVFY